MSQQVKDLQTLVGAAVIDGGLGRNTMLAFKKHFGHSASKTAHFFAQCSHESQGFTKFEENLSYSQAGLLKTFPKYFSTTSASKYAYHPTLIASRVYGNRYGNGNETSKDGWNYRGSGAIQLTFKDNFIQFSRSDARYADVVEIPSLVRNKFAFESALYFFESRGIFSLSSNVNEASIRAVTKKINGGYTGLTERARLTNVYYQWLK